MSGIKSMSVRTQKVYKILKNFYEPISVSVVLYCPSMQNIPIFSIDFHTAMLYNFIILSNYVTADVREWTIKKIW